MDAEDRDRLLRLARASIAHGLEHGGRAPDPSVLEPAPSPGMRRVMGAFVTLHLADRLRGCIGEIVPRRPLYAAVVDRACAAAFGDPRFTPLTAAELPRVHLEISALHPPRPVDSVEGIELGTHGIVLTQHGRSAVFLPQVAPEQGWDLPTTLEHLARKAGLPADAWRTGATFEVFEAEVFGEDAAG